MIVWGGFYGVGSTGGRYNPASDTWEATSTVGAPSVGALHTAVWTGTEMIIWGGSGANAGGRYDPATDSWVATSTLGAPSLVEGGHTAVWTGTEMIIWGGHYLFCDPDGCDQVLLNTGGRYNPATDSWTATSTVGAPAPRDGHRAVWTGTEMIVWGGFGNTGGRYNPATDTWTATTTVGAPSYDYRDHTAVWTNTEMIVWGGIVGGMTGGRYCATSAP
jgi:N-acetylneuraminic acid mutarotase